MRAVNLEPLTSFSLSKLKEETCVAAMVVAERLRCAVASLRRCCGAITQCDYNRGFCNRYRTRGIGDVKGKRRNQKSIDLIDVRN